MVRCKGSVQVDWRLFPPYSSYQLRKSSLHFSVLTYFPDIFTTEHVNIAILCQQCCVQRYLAAVWSTADRLLELGYKMV